MSLKIVKPGASELLVEIARSFIGVEEQGENHGPEVELFQKAVDGRANGEPWCMCFVQFCVQRVEDRLGTTSGIFRSEHCVNVWNNTPTRMRRMAPEPGLIAIWQRRNGSLSGHTGIVVGRRSPEAFTTVEGNTSGGHDIEREGDGVFQKDRRIAGNMVFKLLGFIDPF